MALSSDRARPRILLVTPPLLQPNTPYAAMPLLAGHLQAHGLTVAQADLSLELLLRLFSAERVRQVAAAIRARRRGACPPPGVRLFLRQAARQARIVEEVVVLPHLRKEKAMQATNNCLFQADHQPSAARKLRLSNRKGESIMFAKGHPWSVKVLACMISFSALTCFISLLCMADIDSSKQETFLTRYDTNLVQRAKLLLAYDELQKTAPCYPNIVTNWTPCFTSVVGGAVFNCLSDNGMNWGTEWSKIYGASFGEKRIGVHIIALNSAIRAHEYLVINMCDPSHGKPGRRCEVMSNENKIGFRCFQASYGDQYHYIEFIRNNLWLKIEGTGYDVEPLARDLDRQILELSQGCLGGRR